jgi:hypothetical protein
MTRHAQNGPSLSKATYSARKPMTDAELAAYHARKAAEQEEMARQAAKSRALHKLRHDPEAFLSALGLLSKK